MSRLIFERDAYLFTSRWRAGFEKCTALPPSEKETTKEEKGAFSSVTAHVSKRRLVYALFYRLIALV